METDAGTPGGVSARRTLRLRTRSFRIQHGPHDMVSQTQTLLADVERRILALCDCPDGILQSAVEHHLHSGGSRIRARLALDASQALDLPVRDAVAIATACELLHNASLIHDDLQDRDTERRGQAALWARFGPDIAICAGDLLLSAAYAALATLGETAAPIIAHMHTRVAITIHGQSEDLDCAKLDTLSLAEYEAIAAGKSGPLLSLPIELALRLAGAPDQVSTALRAINNFALGYQMLDDIADADADAVAGEVNAVTIMSVAGAADPERAVRDRALTHLDRAAEIAQSLPATIPDIVSGYIEMLLHRAGVREELPA